MRSSNKESLLCGKLSIFFRQKPNDNRHHEQVPSVQKAFAEDVKNLVNVIEEMGNPFCEESDDLILLDQKLIRGCSTPYELLIGH